MERKPITVAKISVNGRRLHESIIVHPRYVPPDVDHEIISVQGYRRGRTLDILVDQPFYFDGKEYGILNFKGVGANTDEYDMAIHPRLWYEIMQINGRWIGITTAILNRRGPETRVWGAVKTRDAQEEFEHALLAQHGIHQIAHVALNDIPHELSSHICRVEHGKAIYDLSQIVRACPTNIRLEDVAYLREFFPQATITRCIDGYVDPAKIASIDAAVMNAQHRLAQSGKMLFINGDIRRNRLINGTFVDRENYSIEELKPKRSREFILEVVWQTLLYLSPQLRQGYLKELWERAEMRRTKMPYNSFMAEILRPSTLDPRYNPLREAMQKYIAHKN